jgi:hypothetical protein
MNRVVEKRQTWNWLNTIRIGGGDELFEQCGVFGMVPISKDDCELVVVGVHFFGGVKY